ncbi:Crp/Fnr family transcriptional regulator [uncultured Ilyobacter sp.]|uniref:Crp/Fnr family transcriptional regulator n=1 Tax=uncultured Ilyobacter sp. TaxID=544433 RepID=UPI0029C8EAF9|nr:Crp/Fnr family transcriptional regulator [uncultured Ilyobacter sp.]
MNTKYTELFDLNKQNDMRKFFLEILGPCGNVEKYYKGSIVSKDVEKQLYIVKTGAVNISICDIGGEEQMIYRLYPGEILGEFEIFSDVSQNYHLQFLEESSIWKIEKDKINYILEEHPEYYRYFIHSMSRKYNLSLIQAGFSKFYSSEEKLVEFLLRICKIREPNSNRNIKIEGYTHEDIGKGINVSRIGITNILKKLEEGDFVIIKRKLIIVKSVEDLAEYREKIRKK